MYKRSYLGPFIHLNYFFIYNFSSINEPAIAGADLSNFGICKWYRSYRQIRRLQQLDKLIKTNSKQ